MMEKDLDRRILFSVYKAFWSYMIIYMISYQIQDSFIFKTSPMKMRNNGGRVFIFQVQCDAYTCTINKMGSAAYIVNQQAKRLEIRDDGKRPRPSYFVFSLQSVLILYDYIYDIISDPRFFHFQDKSNENEKQWRARVHFSSAMRRLHMHN